MTDIEQMGFLSPSVDAALLADAILTAIREHGDAEAELQGEFNESLTRAINEHTRLVAALTARVDLLDGHREAVDACTGNLTARILMFEKRLKMGVYAGRAAPSGDAAQDQGGTEALTPNGAPPAGAASVQPAPAPTPEPAPASAWPSEAALRAALWVDAAYAVDLPQIKRAAEERS